VRGCYSSRLMEQAETQRLDAGDDPGYALIDFGQGRRLEQWGPVRLIRPDPRATNAPAAAATAWESADATFEGRLDGGHWQIHRPVPATWTMAHAGSIFEVKLGPTMHTGLFPEQSQHWAWMTEAASATAAVHGTVPPGESLSISKSLSILNLFAYTGGASMALARAGYAVTHVDASRPAIGWARRNAALNGVSAIRWIEDDVRTFVRREQRRGRRYDGLLLDPPLFGRGAAGTWRLAHDLDPLLEGAVALLTAEASFALINVYALDANAAALAFQLAEHLRSARHSLSQHQIESGTLDLRAADGRALPTGCFARVSRLIARSP
jgi:23S rRNA (cytosine1962-C5)-methyltransferase